MLRLSLPPSMAMPSCSMTFRMASEEPGIKMPELPNVLSHANGVSLITEWIAAREPVNCWE